MGKRTITAVDETYSALQKVVSVERQGWRYDLVTYAPNRMFNSPKMKINCLDNAFVVNYEGNDGWIQISKKGVQCPTANLQPRK
jgi:hypothetical protein